MEIKIGVPIEKRVEFANWAYPLKHVIGKTIFDLVINDSVDFSKISIYYTEMIHF
jgi:hypothetical protein